MTNISLVKNELLKIFNGDSDSIADFEGYIEAAVACVYSSLNDTDYENDPRIIHLCAVKALNQIALTRQQDDGITSFKAGDISFSKDMSSVTIAKELLKNAYADCRDLLKSKTFAFKVV